MIRRLASAVLALYRREPARANQLAAVAASWLLLKVGLKVDSATVTLAVSGGLAYAAGELTRALVVPVATVDTVIADEVAAVETYAEGGVVTGRIPIVGEGGNPGYPAPWQPVNPGVRKPKP